MRATTYPISEIFNRKLHMFSKDVLLSLFILFKLS